MRGRRTIVTWLVSALVLLASVAALQAWVEHARDSAHAALAVTARESCLDCHQGVRGIEPSHAALGCAPCHLGSASAREKEAAHTGLVRVPGNLSDAPRTCGAAGCHPQMPPRLAANIMTTMNGVVSIDRWLFGEQPTPTAHTPVDGLGESPADTHLRSLCASCHLSREKRDWGPVGELTRGGGCNACHLRYSADAARELETRSDGGVSVHPQLRARPTAAHCFGCHSRSGRISLNFDGWREGDDGGTRVLADGRVVQQLTPDVHSARGLECVDCHTSWEVMGDGSSVLHREEQQRVACTDCHLTAAPVTKRFSEADEETRKVVSLRGGDARPGREFLTVARSGLALSSTLAGDGGVFLESPRGLAPMKAPAPACTAKAHRALSCGACHDAWAPQCLGCHTSFDDGGVSFDLLANQERPGRWQETFTELLAEPPSLGVRESDAGRRVETFTPGMVLTLEPGQSAATFHRLFAPVAPHTVQAAPRSCRSCHQEPLALGYGRGALAYSRLRWRFSPSRGKGPDGLPLDAWVGFLSFARGASTTRADARPFTVAEQRRILTVGTCLTCHEPGSAPMTRALDDFGAVVRAMSARCERPRF